MARLSLILLVSAFSLTACSPLGIATGVGAGVGVAATQEGGLSKAAEDMRIKIQINDLWFRHNVEMFRKLDMTVNQGRVLITGVVQDPEHRVEAVRLAWQPKGVKQVINEITVAEGGGFVGYAKDTWITTRLRAAMTFDKTVQSINYSIDTVQGTVYLMGFAQDRLELNRVTEMARTINGVKNVVSYVKFVGEDGADAPSVDNDPYAYSEPAPGYDNTMSSPQDNYSTYPQDSAYPAADPYADPYAAQSSGDPIVIQPDPSYGGNSSYKEGIEVEVLN